MADSARHDAEDPILLGWARQFRRLPLGERAGTIPCFVQRFTTRRGLPPAVRAFIEHLAEHLPGNGLLAIEM